MEKRSSSSRPRMQRSSGSSRKSARTSVESWNARSSRPTRHAGGSIQEDCAHSMSLRRWSVRWSDWSCGPDVPSAKRAGAYSNPGPRAARIGGNGPGGAAAHNARRNGGSAFAAQVRAAWHTRSWNPPDAGGHLARMSRISSGGRTATTDEISGPSPVGVLSQFMHSGAVTVVNARNEDAPAVPGSGTALA